MKQKFYETTDLALVAYLKLHEFVIEDIQRKDGRAIFILRERPNREKLIREFYNDTTRVPPLKFWNSIGDIKSLLYNYR